MSIFDPHDEREADRETERPEAGLPTNFGRDARRRRRPRPSAERPDGELRDDDPFEDRGGL